MPSVPRQQPFHEPIGLSPEGFTTDRRRLITLFLVLASLVAGAVTLYGLTA